MRLQTTFAIFFMLLLALPARAEERIALYRMKKEETPLATRLHLEFSSLPAYRLHTSGQRIDLFLDKVTVASSLRNLPEEGSVIKILLGAQGAQTVVSFLFNRPPKRIEALTLKEPRRLTLEVHWEGKKSSPQPAITSNVGGMPTVARGGAVVRQSRRSAYAGRWREFFAAYEVPLKNLAALRYSLPQLTALVYAPSRKDEIGRTLHTGIEQGNRGQWQDALAALERLPAPLLQGSDREAYLISFGEALVRNGAYQKGMGMLAEFIEANPHSPLKARARYLGILADAAAGEPHRARVELAALLKDVEENRHYLPHCMLLQAELALAKGSHRAALTWLEKKGVPFVGALADLRRLRLADAWRGMGQNQKALPVYRELLDRAGYRESHPYSLASYAEALYREGQYLAAAKRFSDLAGLSAEDSGKALAHFAAARSELRAGEEALALVRLGDIRNNFPGTEGASRAWLAEIDLAVVQEKSLEGPAPAAQYGTIAKQAPLRELREEAALKAALVLSLGGEQLASIQSLRTFLRHFGSGALRGEAEALLTELLPGVVSGLLGRGEDLPALVLVEQNRTLLASGQVDPGLLLEMGDAFVRVGLLDKAYRVYRYMLEAVEGKAGEERFYLPLVKVLCDQQNYELAVEYAGRYLERFPVGADWGDLRYLQGEALYKSGRLEAAARLLADDGQRSSRDLEVLAGRVFWELGRLEGAARLLRRAAARSEDGPVEPQVLVLLAEALFRVGKRQEALPLYERLAEARDFADQALYRCAQIRLAEGKRETALNILRRLAEESRNPQWQRMAAESLDLAELQRP